MKKFLPIILFVVPLAFVFSSCRKVEPVQLPPEPVQQTVFMYLPWSGNLTGYFYENISDFENALGRMNLPGHRVLAFISDPATSGTLYELKNSNGNRSRKVLKTYTEPALTSQEWITAVLKDVQSFAPAEKYAMTIGCHGMGWVPVTPPQTASMRVMSVESAEKFHWEYGDEDKPMTRFFGGTSSQYQTEISTLADGIAGAGMKMEYILFDDCYMSCIEVAYELKDVADHLIASPTEIMAVGMPYFTMGKYLLGDIDYENAVNEFHSFFTDYSSPYGTIAVTVCSELEALARVMKEINSNFAWDGSKQNSVQSMDGYGPTIFFDMADYVSKLCTDQTLLAKFQTQFEKTVPAAYKRHTPYYYTNSRGALSISTYSGITISDPTENTADRYGAPSLSKTETAWYAATH